MRLDGKTVFITGGGSGIGREAAVRCAESGATVVVADIDGDAAAETADQLRGSGATADARELDVRDHERVSAVVDAAAAEYGLDAMINNAGISHPRENMEDLGSDVRDRVVDVNVNGVWNGCHAAIPHLKERGEGAIVNTASLAGLIGSPGAAAYSLSKGAVVNFTRAIAAELGPHGVRANAVCPGVVETPLVTGDRDDEEWEQLRDRMAENYPLRRLGRPEDVANAIRFLASEESAWITGHALKVDGGFSCA